MTTRLAAAWICALVTVVPSEAAADWIVRPFVGAARREAREHTQFDLDANRARMPPCRCAECHLRVARGSAPWVRPMASSICPGDLVSEGRVTTLNGQCHVATATPHASSRLRAYGTGGAGVVRPRLEDALDAFSFETSLAAGNAGGGVLVRVRPRVDINADARYFRTQFGDVDRAGFSEQFVSFTRLTTAVVLRF